MITIIVLLILAGVSIAMLTGENGILTQAQRAKTQTDIGEEKEQIAIAYNGVKIRKNGESVTGNELTSEFETNGVDATASGKGTIIVTFENGKKYAIDESGNITAIEEPETGGSIETMSYGVVEIKWLSGTTNKVSETANAPVVESVLPAGTTMELVRYEEGTDGAEGNWVTGTDYSYIEGTGTLDNNQSRWANAKVTIDGVDSYFVWVPRYAYKIIYFDTQEHKEAYMNDKTQTEGIIGYSDSRGLVDKEGKKVGEENRASINVGDYFRVHPVFTSDIESGGWDEELSGIWIGKYETARSNATINSSGNETVIKVQPGVQSWSNIDIGMMYSYAKDYSSRLNSHMLKNSEWGAVVYLTESKYGRNGNEVTKNNSSTRVTGSAGNSISAEADVGTTNDYWSEQGVLASTTGNVYGVYDLSGGAGEYLASYYVEGNSSFGGALMNEEESCFVTKYMGVSDSLAYRAGDATYETKGWHNDEDFFITKSGPFFYVGGTYNYGENASIFGYDWKNGCNEIDVSFRMCLIIK